MTLWEKIDFWAMPVLWALPGVGLLAVTAFGLAEISVDLLVNFHKYIHHLDRLKILEPVPEVVALTVALSGAYLVFPILGFRDMARRRKETGSMLPQGEELAARRRKKKNPSLWTRLFVIGLFCWVAVGVTYSLMTSAHRHVLINWGFPALFWLIAGLVAIDGLFPSPGRTWTGFVATGAFGLLAILAVAGDVHARAWGVVNWIFPLLMASFSGGLGINSIRKIRRRSAPPGEPGGERP